MMKVCLVTQSLPAHSVGGREKHTYHLAQYLSENGIDVDVLTSSDSIRSYQEKEAGFDIHYLRSIKIPVSGTYMRMMPGLHNNRAIRNSNVVHAHEIFHLSSYLSAISAKRNKRAFVLTEHGYPEQVGAINALMGVYRRVFASQIVKSCDRIIAVSDALGREIVQRFNADNVTTIHNAVSVRDCKTKNREFLERFGLQDKRVIFSSGRLIREKGFQFLIEAMKVVCARFSDAVCVITGPDNYYKAHLSRLVLSNGLKDKVVFTGVISEELLKSAIYSCDMVAIPSLYEPFSTSMLEAMAFGKPIVATRVGGMPEALTHGRNSLLVEPTNSDSLALAIVELFLNRALAKRLGKNAKRDVRKFDWKVVVKDIIKLYEEVLDERT